MYEFKKLRELKYNGYIKYTTHLEVGKTYLSVTKARCCTRLKLLGFYAHKGCEALQFEFQDYLLEGIPLRKAPYIIGAMGMSEVHTTQFFEIIKDSWDEFEIKEESEEE